MADDDRFERTSVYEKREALAPQLVSVSNIAKEGRERSRKGLNRLREQRDQRLARAAASSNPCVRACANAWIYLALQCVCTVFVVLAAFYVASLAVGVVDLVGITSLPPGVEVVSYQSEDLRPALEQNMLVRAEEAAVTVAEQAAEATFGIT